MCVQTGKAFCVPKRESVSCSDRAIEGGRDRARSPLIHIHPLRSPRGTAPPLQLGDVPGERPSSARIPVSEEEAQRVVRLLQKRPQSTSYLPEVSIKIH